MSPTVCTHKPAVMINKADLNNATPKSVTYAGAFKVPGVVCAALSDPAWELQRAVHDSPTIVCNTVRPRYPQGFGQLAASRFTIWRFFSRLLKILIFAQDVYQSSWYVRSVSEALRIK